VKRRREGARQPVRGVCCTHVPDRLQAVKRPAHSPDDGAQGIARRTVTPVTGEHASEHEVVDQYPTSQGSETPVREVDRRNGNMARARKQAEASPRLAEDEEGNVHRLKATSLVIPEERRCKALTVHGRRCRVGKMRGMEVCVFHAHHALTDEGLAALADSEAKPRLSPRKALKAVVALKGQELAEAAVDGALSEDGARRTRAVLDLVDAVDPLTTEEASITLSREGAETATWRQLAAVFGAS
jgi:hypothetical protein